MSEQINEIESEEVQDDQLATLPAERLAAMLRDKRKSEATYRTKLRDTEADRDKLAGAVGGFQQAAFRDAAQKAGVLASALPDLASFVPLESVLGEDGLVDQEKATAALADLKLSRPHCFPAVATASGGDFGGSIAHGAAYGEASWSDVLK